MLFGKSHKFSTLKTSLLNTQTNRSRFLFGGDIGDTIDDAENIGKLSKSSNYKNSGDVGGENDLDFYTFKVKKSGTIKLKIENEDSGEPIELSIVNKRGKVVSVNGKRLFTEIDPEDKGKLSGKLEKGTYYLKFECEDGRNQDYNFTLKFNSKNDDKEDEED